MTKLTTLPNDTKDLFSKQATWQSWLMVEGALAQAQGETGMIPLAASTEIRRHMRIEDYDLDALEAEITQSMSPVMAIVRAMAARCDGDAGGYVHWGATTQNIIITGKMLQLRKAHTLTLERLGRCLTLLSDMARKTADWPTISRTNRRQALPITFGYKVAGWIDEFQRCVERLIEVEKRTFVLTFGGASGAMHSYGPNGFALSAKLADILGLEVSAVHSRATNDGLGEYVAVLGLLAVACERMGNELYTLMANEFGEVFERQSENVVGSSTMPHKTNPKYVVALLAESAHLRNMVAPALEACRPSHEGDAAFNFRLYDLLDAAGISAYGVVTRLETLLTHLECDKAAMYRNLMINPAPLMSEKIMLELAKSTGRQNAHDIVHHAIVVSERDATSFADALWQEKEVSSHFKDKTTLAGLLDPATYTGCSAEIASKLANAGAESAEMVAKHARKLSGQDI
ncbi:lyase family protein [Thalassospira povalilytica]|uniref:Fumarate lyase n=1 Tax=Thalassospira povalilytica TaxID=732237 RepID=A0ABX4R915_9PROT|nr:lyase family protein [Thalassospira povalilytica]PKR49782.1 fumarate lyase [Thalassospira povalilytica]